MRGLASDGAAVAFTYTASADKATALAEEVAAAGGRALTIQADSADPQALARAVADTLADFGRLDVLANNAGILLPGLVDDYPLADFDRMVAVNVRAVFAAVQAALPHLGEGARIISTGSVVADRVGFPGASVYAMTKAAVAGLTRGLARDLGPRGITVNAIQPGPTETSMAPADVIGNRVRPLIPLGRMGRDSEIASLVAYLAGPEAGFSRAGDDARVHRPARPGR